MNHDDSSPAAALQSLVSTLALSLSLLLTAPAVALADGQPLNNQPVGKQQLGEQLAENAPQCGRFEQSRWLADLDTRLDSRGVFRRQDDALVWHTYSPVDDRVVLSADNSQLPPGLQAMLPVFNGLLSGDWQALERHFSVTLEGRLSDWQARLAAKDSRLAAHLSRLVVKGGKAVESVELEFAEGDRLTLRLSPLSCDQLDSRPDNKPSTGAPSS